MLGHRSYYFLFLVPALALSACGGDKSIDDMTGATEEAIPVGVHLAGTYMGDTHQPGDFSQLVLKTDGTYHARVFVACIAQPCRDVEQNGRYALFYRESVKYFQTYDASGVPMARYQYALLGDTLKVRRLIPQATWSPMLRASAGWCAVDKDCALQQLPIGPCAGHYICTERSSCNWSCGAAPEIAADGTKARTGG